MSRFGIGLVLWAVYITGFVVSIVSAENSAPWWILAGTIGGIVIVVLRDFMYRQITQMRDGAPTVERTDYGWLIKDESGIPLAEITHYKAAK